jgi:hypothetical protein
MRTLELISAEIAARAAKLTSTREGGAKLAAERGKIEQGILSDRQALVDAEDALANAQAGAAMGEVDAPALAAALAALTAAQKACAKSGEREPEVARIAAAERQLAARAAPLEAELVDLNAELVEAKKEVRLSRLEADMREEIVRYTEAASATMLALGKSYAQHQALQAAGRDPGLFTTALHQAQLGSYLGYPLTGSFADALAAERARLAAVA